MTGDNNEDKLWWMQEEGSVFAHLLYERLIACGLGGIMLMRIIGLEGVGQSG